MNKYNCIKRIKMIFTIDIIDRINIISDSTDNVTKIIIDVHGLSCSETRKNINNLINLTFSNCMIEVIHGYLHGTSIKTMLHKSNYFRKFNTVSDIHNMGITYLVCA